MLPCDTIVINAPHQPLWMLQCETLSTMDLLQAAPKISVPVPAALLRVRRVLTTSAPLQHHAPPAPARIVRASVLIPTTAS